MCMVKQKEQEQNPREGVKNFCRVINSLTEGIELSYLRKLGEMRVARVLYLSSNTGNKLTLIVDTLKSIYNTLISQFQTPLT